MPAPTKSKVKNPKVTELLLAEGALYLNLAVVGKEVELGAIGDGGSNFKVEPEFTEPSFHGKKGSVKGLRRKKSVKVTLTVNAIQFTSDKIAQYFAGIAVDKATSQTYDILKGRQILDTDYFDNVAFVGMTQDGREVAVIVKNALGDGGLELAFDGKDNIVTPVQFTGHYDPINLDEEPWEIRWGKTANVGIASVGAPSNINEEIIDLEKMPEENSETPPDGI